MFAFKRQLYDLKAVDRVTTKLANISRGAMLDLEL